MGINWTEVIISLCTLIITGVLVPLVTAKWKAAKAEMSKDDYMRTQCGAIDGVRILLA